MTITRMFAQTVNCRSLDETCEFYTSVFGFREVSPSEALSLVSYAQLLGLPGDAEAKVQYLAEDPVPAGNVFIRLVEWVSPKPAGMNAYPSPNHIGMVRTQFTVDDFDGTRQRLLDAGSRLITDTFEWLGHGTSTNPPKPQRVLVATDPNGVVLQVKER